MVNRLLFIIILLFSITADAQTLKGRIVSGNSAVADVFVINKKTGAETKADVLGYFTIAAKPGESIVVYNTKISVREFILTSASFNEQPYLMSVNYQTYEMDEVVIDKKIDAVSLGLVPKDQKRYTVAERRLYSASGGAFGIDLLINYLSGRWRMLKMDVKTEKKEIMIETVRGLYNEDEIVNLFDIPAEHVDGFLYYLAEKEYFMMMVKEGNKAQVGFIMADFAKDYMALQTDDK